MGVVHDISNAKKLLLSSGVYPLNIGKEKNDEKYSNMDEMFEEAVKIATEEGRIQQGDKVVFIGGTPLWTLEEANFIQIRRVWYNLLCILGFYDKKLFNFKKKLKIVLLMNTFLFLQ